jgi:hypothetical protein
MLNAPIKSLLPSLACRLLKFPAGLMILRLEHGR